MPVVHANQKTRQILLGAAVATLLGAGGASVAYASANGPTEQTGYAIEVTTQDDAASQSRTDDECERKQQLREDGQQGTQTVAPPALATSDVRGDL
jgi:hypothetical protein